MSVRPQVRPLRALGLVWQVRTEGRELPTKPHTKSTFDHAKGCHTEILSPSPPSSATIDSATASPEASSESDQEEVAAGTTSAFTSASVAAAVSRIGHELQE